jgi:ankyrin repeat protein
MQLLLEKGANAKEADLLQFGVQLNRLAMVEQLLAAGADVNANGAYERTALQEAVSCGHADMVHLLLTRPT